MLNRNQKIVVFIACGFIALSYLFPCWYEHPRGRTAYVGDHWLPNFIFSPPQPTDVDFVALVDYKQMLVQITAISIIAAFLALAFRTKK
jgi:hypothetical protein